MTTVVLLAVIAAIALGAPTLALLADRRLKPPRLRTGAEDVLRELARTHRLTTAELEQVRAAVRLGNPVEPRLRPAVLSYAAELTRSNRFASWPRRRRLAFGAVLVVLLTVSLTAALIYSLDRRHYFNAGQVIVLAGYYVGIVVYARRRRRALRRAVNLATPQANKV